MRLREEADEAQLRGVDVLELVDAHVREARLPAAAQAGIRFERPACVDDQVVEVPRTSPLQLPGVVVDERLPAVRDRGPLHLQRGDRTVELAHVEERRGVRRSPDSCPPPRSPQEGTSVRHQVSEGSGVEQDLASERVQRADLDLLRLGVRRDESGEDPFAELLRRLAVEGDDADAPGRHATREEDAKARDEGRGLPAAGGGDDLGGTVPERCSRALLRVQPREELVGLPISSFRWHLDHAESLLVTAYRPMRRRVPR